MNQSNPLGSIFGTFGQKLEEMQARQNTWKFYLNFGSKMNNSSEMIDLFRAAFVQFALNNNKKTFNLDVECKREELERFLKDNSCACIYESVDASNKLNYSQIWLLAEETVLLIRSEHIYEAASLIAVTLDSKVKDKILALNVEW